MDTAHWPQGIGIGVVDVDNKASIMEESSISAASRGAANNAILERKLARPQKDQALNCPRCNSTTTKFCYYNNYSLSQPRYFCKTCRRYWTEGGSLRNVPVGGGSRKNNKRPSSDSSSSPSSSSANKKVALHHGQIGNFASESPKINFQGQDLNLAYPPGDQEYDNNITDVPPFTIDNKSNYHHHHHQNPSSLVSSQHHNFSSAMELLKSGMASRGMPSFVPMVAVPGDHPGNVTMFGGGFVTMQEFKASGGGGGLGFSLGGFDQSGGFESTNNSSSHARLLFPSDQDLKQQINPSTNVTATAASEFDDHQQNGGGEERDSGGGGYWNGMLGGGSW